MKYKSPMLVLLRQFLLPFSGGWPWMSYLGLALLALALVVGVFVPRVAFGIAMASYVFLLALPYTLTPKVWRMLISNRQLALTPGFARKVTLAAFLVTLLQAVYLNFFAALYVLPTLPWQQTALMFISQSLYMIFMQYAVTTTWALVALSFLPTLSLAALLLIMQGFWRSLLGDDHVLWLTVACLLAWLLAWWSVGRRHQFRSQHNSVAEMRDWQNPRLPVAPWLLHDSKAAASPVVSLLLGYPANPVSRIRVLAFSVYFGPLVATLLLALLNFGQDWHWRFHPTALEIFLGCSLFPATFNAFQHIDWVARLRLFWLRSDLSRSRMWTLLERELLIHTGMLLAINVALMFAALVFTQFSVGLLPHYPLLVLCFNAFYSYYMVCARIGNWSHAAGLLLAFGGSVLLYFAWYFAFRTHSSLWLFALELIVAGAALYLRPRARRMLITIDWLRVKPVGLAKLAN